MGTNSEDNDALIKAILDENGLKLKKVPEGQNSLMRAVSCCLYLTSTHFARVQKLCVDYLDQTPEKELPETLVQFRANSYKSKDFRDNPTLPSFEQTNLEIVSKIFNIEVRVYSVNLVQKILQCKILNSKHSKCMRLFKSKEAHFHCLLEEEHFANLGFCQNIVFNVVSNLHGNEQGRQLFEWKNSNQDKYVDLELKYSKRGRPDSQSPKKERNGSSAKNFNLNGIVESGLAQTAKAERQKPGREPTSSLEKKSYSFFKTEHKKEKSRDKNEFIGSLKRPGPRESAGQLGELSVLTELERSGPPRDAAGSELAASNVARSNRNSSSMHGSPDPLPKKPDAVYSSAAPARQPQAPPGSLAYPPFGLGLPAPMAAVAGTPLKPGVLQGFHSDNKFVLPSQPVPPVGLGVGLGVPHNPTLFQMLFTPKSTKPPGLGLAEEPQLLKSISAPHDSKPPGLGAAGDTGSKNKPLDESKRYTGRLKFFDEAKNYGFIVMDEDGSDIFVHYDDLVKANLPKEHLKTAKKGNNINLSFGCLNYIGKHKHSKKAVDIQLIP